MSEKSEKRLFYIMALAVAAGVTVAALTGNLGRETTPPGEALQTDDASGHWKRYVPFTTDSAAEELTTKRARLIEQALKTYALIHAGNYPEALQSLVEEELLMPEAILDGWERPFAYARAEDAKSYSLTATPPEE